MRRHRFLAAVGIAVSVAVLAGCTNAAVWNSHPEYLTHAAPGSRLDAYETRAEQIHAGLLARLPAGAEPDIDTTSRASIDVSDAFSPSTHDAATWTTESTIELGDDTTSTASSVAAALGAHLRAQGWTADPATDYQGGADVPYSGFYRLAGADGEWIVQLGWNDGRRVVALIQSPVTTRDAGGG